MLPVIDQIKICCALDSYTANGTIAKRKLTIFSTVATGPNSLHLASVSHLHNVAIQRMGGGQVECPCVGRSGPDGNPEAARDPQAGPGAPLGCPARLRVVRANW